MIDRIVNAARAITPPEHDADPKEHRAWRLNVFWTLLALILVTSFHLAAAGGWLETVGISGVANASEVKQNGKTSRAILRRLALPEIRAKVRHRCRAETDVDRDRIARDLDRLLEQFKTDTGEDFGKLPTCADV